MHLTLKSSLLAEIAVDWLVVGVWEKESLAGPASILDAKLGGLLSRLHE